MALAHAQNHPNSYLVLLAEETGERRLPVVIGGAEAQSIAIAAQGIVPDRPMTHDLISNTLQRLNIELEEVVISELREGVFYSTLYCKSAEGINYTLDSRTSDALALAMRSKCPIFTYAPVMDEAGINADEEKEAIDPSKPVTEYSDNELEELLEEALSTENYERAADIRDELNRRADAS